jgi:hypothetical protein
MSTQYFVNPTTAPLLYDIADFEAIAPVAEVIKTRSGTAFRAQVRSLQDDTLRPEIGDELYKVIIDAKEAEINTATPMPSRLVDLLAVSTGWIAYMLLYRVTLSSTYRYTNSGIVREQPAGTTAPTLQEMQHMQTQHIQMSDAYKARFRKYLQDNADLYPEAQIRRDEGGGYMRIYKRGQGFNPLPRRERGYYQLPPTHDDWD